MFAFEVHFQSEGPRVFYYHAFMRNNAKIMPGPWGIKVTVAARNRLA
jgi:hypothetical protein